MTNIRINAASGLVPTQPNSTASKSGSNGFALSSAAETRQSAGRRVAGWVKAAKEGCAALGRTSGPEKAECENMLIRNSLTFSVAHEGNPGVNLIIGANGNVSVPAGAKASAGAE